MEARIVCYRWDENLQRSVPVAAVVETDNSEAVDGCFTMDEIKAILLAVLKF